MVTRKIVQHGSSSLTVSLPHKWTKEHNLKKGDEINVETKGRSVIIRLDKEKSQLELKRSYKKQPFMKRHLLQAYHHGYDRIELTFESKIPLSEILTQLDELLGFEIVEQSPHHCIIINVANTMSEEFESMLKRLFQLTLSFSNNIVDMSKGSNFDLLPSLFRMEKETNRLSSFCQRSLNKGVVESLYDTTNLFSLVDRIELIGDALRDICKYLSTTKEISKDDLFFFKEINSYFQDVFINYYATIKNVKMLKEKRTSFMGSFESRKMNPLLVYLRIIVTQLHHIEVSL